MGVYFVQPADTALREASAGDENGPNFAAYVGIISC